MVHFGADCECTWERLGKDEGWTAAQPRYVSVQPLDSADQCELACCYRELGCAAYTYTAQDRVCKLWVDLDGTHTEQDNSSLNPAAAETYCVQVQQL